MQKENGQIQIVVIILAIIAIILFVIFSRSNPGILPNYYTAPDSQNKTIISPPKQEIAPQAPSNEEPSPVIDAYAPFRSNGQPSGGLPFYSKQAYISLNTNENAVCRYTTVSGVAYDSMQYAFSETGGTFHQSLITALSEGGAYNYYIKCADGQGNKNIDDFVIAFWVNYPADFTPPVLSNGYPSGDLRLPYSPQTMIGISTNEPASCRYSWTQGTGYNSMSKNLSQDSTKQYHTANITGLVYGNTYNYFVRCKDLSGNINTGDVMIRFTVLP